MTACCVSGYRPLRDIRLDECHWPPTLAPAGPWEICGCADGVELGERMAAMAARNASGIMTPIAEAVVTIMKHGAVGRTDERVEIAVADCNAPGLEVRLPISGDGVQFAVLFQEPRTCSTCPEPAKPEPVIEWHEHWRTWLCPECGSVLAEEGDR